jgi:undecaprenyl-diphosphatase
MLEQILSIDYSLNNFFVNNFQEGNFFYLFFSMITQLGNYKIVLLLSFIFSLYIWYKDDFRFFGNTSKKWLIPFWTSLVIAEGITFTLKKVIDRAGPVGRSFLEHDASFPSGHATIAVAFFGILAFLLFQNINLDKRRRFFIQVLTGIIIFLIAFSRLVLNVHYVSDILVGLLVGTFGFLCGKAVFRFLN